jgi:antitoxin (DNA-binding transcriptional repressor) of toxin-antitoxin stability system
MNVAVRELKDHLSEYLKRAKNGEEVVITSHGKPVARLAALPPAPENAEAAAIERLEAQPWIIPAKKSGPFPVHKPVAPTREGEEPMSDIELGMRE